MLLAALYVKRIQMKQLRFLLNILHTDLELVKPEMFKTQSDFLKKISSWKFKTNPLTENNH